MSGSKASYLKRVFAIKRKFDLRYGGFRLARACIRHDARGSDDAYFFLFPIWKPMYTPINARRRPRPPTTS
jgi:hypothetical protein